MRDITINNNGSQEENQKTTPVTESIFEPASSIHYLSGVIFSTWLPCTLKFEPTSSKMADAQPCRLRGHTRAPPARKTVL